MPIASGANNMDGLKFGSLQVSELYLGVQQVWSNIITLTLNSATDVNLRTFIDGQGDYTGKRVRVNVPAGQTIGSAVPAEPALNTGNLSIFEWVELWNYGEIQGAGGAANSGDGGDAISATTNLTIYNYGYIRGGGGGGGVGGQGGYGDDATMGSPVYSDNPPYYLWTYVSVSNPCYWNGTNLGFSDGRSHILYSGYVYKPGDNYVSAFYYIKRGQLLAGTKGSGGAGGKGTGYGQTLAGGSTGTNGTRRAGKGGTGGSGNTWGEAGVTGNPGYIGYKYTTTSSSVGTSGASGAGGGDAGNGLTGNSFITWGNQGSIFGAIV